MTSIFRGCCPHRTGKDNERGIALVMVIGMMSVATLFMVSSLAFVLNNAPGARRDQDSKIAVAAAEAGIEDYISRLNNDDNYWRLENNDPQNAAFTDAGTDVQGTGGLSSSFRYRVVSTLDETYRNGIVKLKVQGRSGPDDERTIERTLVATLKAKSFLEYGYLSDIESLDPALAFSDSVPVRLNGVWGYFDLGDGGVRNACSDYYYNGRDEPDFEASEATPVYKYVKNKKNQWVTEKYTSGTVDGFSCGDIVWGSADTVNGPMHSNDALNIDGTPTFTSPNTTTSWGNPDDPNHLWIGGGTPADNLPKYGEPVKLPDSNSELKNYVSPNPIDPSKPGSGCYYRGATRIIFRGTTMDVQSPSTTQAPARCYNTSPSVRGTMQIGKAIPPLIFVDGTTEVCTTGAIGFPMAGELISQETTDYDCHRGTAYVQGTVDGQVTIATLDDIVITGNLITQDRTQGTDNIGLIAGSYVWVYHPVSDKNNPKELREDLWNLYIEAGIVALRHGFAVQNWRYGHAAHKDWWLNVTGSITQKFRGPVATYKIGTEWDKVWTGYNKNYKYDPRLGSVQPPFFLSPRSASWAATSVADAAAW